MNFIFISPHFPDTCKEYCKALKRNGVNVLGIADAPFDSLNEELKGCLTEYYKVNNMESYDEMYRAVAFLAFKYGKIDWIESNNEYWLEQDARLRTDFNVTTGVHTDLIKGWKEKSAMKELYAKGKVPTARQIKGEKGAEAIWAFAELTGYPLFAKPDNGVGANGTYKIQDAEQMQAFLNETNQAEGYVIEEFVTGNIYSYDAVVNAEGEPIFESMTAWPPSLSDIVNQKLDLYYCVQKDVDPKLREIGRRTVKAFGVKSRWIHFEFFKLNKAHKGLGKKGDFVGLEVNMRPAGGNTPDMTNFAHSVSVHQIWADMVAFNESRTQEGEQFFCVYTGRRDVCQYVHTHEEILQNYESNILMQNRIPDVLSPAMGNQYYIARFSEQSEVDTFKEFVQQRQ